jgi:hypothetical protein
MDIADVKKQVLRTIERARRGSAERRVRAETAARAYETFLERTAVPVCRQVSNVLRAEGYVFEVFTPAGSVRLMSDRSADDYIELVLETSGDQPVVTGRTSRRRGQRTLQSETAIGDPEALGEDEVLAFVLKALEPFVER